MNGRTTHDLEACDGGCKFCSGARPAADAKTAGWRLILACAGAFLTPVLLATAGAIAFGGSETGRLLGALGGFAIGMAAAIIVGKRLRAQAATTDDNAGPGPDAGE